VSLDYPLNNEQLIICSLRKEKKNIVKIRYDMIAREPILNRIKQTSKLFSTVDNFEEMIVK